MSAELSPPRGTDLLLALVAGYVDTTGFIALGQVFLAHVTGNLVLIGAGAAGDPVGSLALQLLVPPLFVTGVIVGWLISRREGRNVSVGLATGECLALVACGLLGATTIAGAPSTLNAPFVVTIAFGTVAMGLHSMLGRVLRIRLTNVMTGNITQLTVDLMRTITGERDQLPEVFHSLALVVSFAVGTVLAGLIVPRVGLGSLLIPAAVMAFIAIRLWSAVRLRDRERREGEPSSV